MGSRNKSHSISRICCQRGATNVTDRRILEEQKAYYRARAAEYDEWFYREGRYDHGVVKTLGHGLTRSGSSSSS